MIVYTDSVEHARAVTGLEAEAWTAPASFADDDARRVAEHAYGDDARIVSATTGGDDLWTHLFLVDRATQSHYDLLVDLGQHPGRVPHGVLMLAGSGTGFHGFRGRAWSAPPGNVYLVAHLAPSAAEADRIEHAGTCFTVLAAVSVVDAIDAIPGMDGRAGIKWVNDVLIDGAKVSGVLGYTRSHGGRITGAILGIGLNVETDPVVVPTPTVPRAASLRGLGADCTVGTVFAGLSEALARNYRALAGGGYASLVSRYRDRSLVIGSEVAICSEDSGVEASPEPRIVASGRVTAISDDLALSIEGVDEPVTRGRVILDRSWTTTSS